MLDFDLCGVQVILAALTSESSISGQYRGNGSHTMLWVQSGVYEPMKVTNEHGTST